MESLAQQRRMTTPPVRAVDLRRSRTPEIEIRACPTYDFFLSLHVALASPELDYVDFDIGPSWMDGARARLHAYDATALSTLQRYFGNETPGSLHATALVSLIPQCSTPDDTILFLNWLATLPIERFVEALFDQEGLGEDWYSLLVMALDEQRMSVSDTIADSASDANARPLVGEAGKKLLDMFTLDVRPTIIATLRAPEAARTELLGALRAWENAVFSAERPRIEPLLQREAATLGRWRTELAPEQFLKLVMRGVEWRRPGVLRKLIFAPSYFCGPAIYYHLWRDTLTFCAPLEVAPGEQEGQRADPQIPRKDMLRFFNAVSDTTRLRILRLLAEREMYLTELAEKLGLTKATTKHHMVRLRAAGCVTILDSERRIYYQLNPDIARTSSELLQAYLHVVSPADPRGESK